MSSILVKQMESDHEGAQENESVLLSASGVSWNKDDCHSEKKKKGFLISSYLLSVNSLNSCWENAITSHTDYQIRGTPSLLRIQSCLGLLRGDSCILLVCRHSWLFPVMVSWDFSCLLTDTVCESCISLEGVKSKPNMGLGNARSFS
ncbi:uncharacterized protein GJ701_009784 isoform 1-T1 [Geothlypis trichas]